MSWNLVSPQTNTDPHFSCLISSTVRLAYLADYWRKLTYIFDHELNWYAAFTLSEFAKSWWMTWIWALIEPCTSIMAACLPTLRPLVDGLGDKHPWIGKLFGALYPRTLFSRSTKYSSSGPESSTEMSKVQVGAKKGVEVSVARVGPSRPDRGASQLYWPQREAERSPRDASVDVMHKIDERDMV